MEKQTKLLKIKKLIESIKTTKKLPTKEEVKLEIEQKRNHSWFRETIRNNELAEQIMEDLEKGITEEKFLKKYSQINYVQFKYLVDNDITKLKFIYESFKLAKSLKANGVKKGDEIVVFMDRTPEYTYIIGAASIIGAQINFVCEKFTEDFLVNKILAPNNGNKKVVFIQDTKAKKLKSVIEKSDANIFVVPFDRSAKVTKTYDKYIKKYYSSDYAQNFTETQLLTYDELLESGINYTGKVEEKSTLDDPFTISYSSGTTGEPKGIIHANRHYITMARYHDTEVSGIPSISMFSTYSNIPSYSNSYISSALSDNIIIGGLIMLDPVDTMEYFKIGLYVNKANMNIASCSSWEKLALDYFGKKNKFKNYRIREALFNFAVGEEFQPGTEKLCNNFLKEVKAGTSFSIKTGKQISSPIPLAKMCVAGGSCETGSLYLRLFRSIFSKMTNRKNREMPIGMSAYDFVEQKILREDGSEAKPYELGRLVINSDCTMLGYKNNQSANEEFYIKDNTGKKWVDMKVYAYKDEHENITIKDRIEKKLDEQLEFKIADIISKDTKNICSVVVVEVEPSKYVAHIIFQPKTKINKQKVLNSATKRIVSILKQDITIMFTEHDHNNYFPLTKSLKKDKKAMKIQGYDNVIELEQEEKISLRYTKKN